MEIVFITSSRLNQFWCNFVWSWLTPWIHTHRLGFIGGQYRWGVTGIIIDFYVVFIVCYSLESIIFIFTMSKICASTIYWDIIYISSYVISQSDKPALMTLKHSLWTEQKGGNISSYINLYSQCQNSGTHLNIVGTLTKLCENAWIYIHTSYNYIILH